MWTRQELKDKAKISLNKNYWRTVLVAAIISVLFAGGSGASFSNTNFKDLINNITEDKASTATDSVLVNEADFDMNNFTGYDTEQSFEEYLENHGATESDEVGTLVFDDNQSSDTIGKGKFNLYKDMAGLVDSDEFVGILAIIGIVFVILFIIILAVSIVMDVFIINPIELGVHRFSLQNLNAPANVGEVGYGFDRNYKNNIKTLFLKDLYTALWTLLFIIPGIVKSYEYRMIPYLLAENPEMTPDQAFAESKAMMTGNKWNAFLLDLSFIGWYFLSAFTAGLLGIFYVAPYKMMTNAALYERLRYGMPQQQMPQEQIVQEQ